MGPIFCLHSRLVPDVSQEAVYSEGRAGAGASVSDHSCYFLLRSRRWQFSGNNSPSIGHIDWGGELTFGHIIPSSEYIQPGAGNNTNTG